MKHLLKLLVALSPLFMVFSMESSSLGVEASGDSNLIEHHQIGDSYEGLSASSETGIITSNKYIIATRVIAQTNANNAGLATSSTSCSAQPQTTLQSWPWYPAIAVSNTSSQSYLAGVMPDNHVYIWDVATRDRLRTIPAFNPERNPRTNEERRLNNQPLPSQITAVAISSDGTTLATGLRHNVTILWNVSDGQDKVVLPSPSGSVSSLSFSHDNRFLAIAYGEAKRVLVWDLRQIFSKSQTTDTPALSDFRENTDYYELKDENLTNTNPQGPKADQTWVESVVFSPDGDILATSGSGRNFKLWDTSTWKLIQTQPLEGAYKGALQLAFSSDNRVLATAIRIETPESAGEVRLWNVEDPSNIRLLHTFAGFTDAVRSVSFNEQYLLAGSNDGTVRAWNLRTRQEAFRQCADSSGIGSVVFDPSDAENRSFVSVSNSGLVKFWTISNIVTRPSTADPLKILTGILLIAYSLLALYLLHISRKQLMALICSFLESLNNLIHNGKSLNKSISHSAKIINACGEEVLKTAKDLKAGEPQVMYVDYDEGNKCTSLKYDVTRQLLRMFVTLQSKSLNLKMKF
jgi:WD40 repeat protein